MLDNNEYPKGLSIKVATAIQKIQGLGYTFTFDLMESKYQACLNNPDGTLEVIHSFADWHEVIKWVEDNIDNPTQETPNGIHE